MGLDNMYLSVKLKVFLKGRLGDNQKQTSNELHKSVTTKAFSKALGFIYPIIISYI